MSIYNKTNLFLKTIGYYLAGLLLLFMQGITLLFLGVYRLWEYFRYQVQVLRYPPPTGGMYGNMARAYKNKDNRR